MQSYRFDFEWDPVKARSNLGKHGVSFEQATEIFLDPFALNMPDPEHGEGEERWISQGRDDQGRILIVCHTYQEKLKQRAQIRIFSARKASKAERKRYEDTP